MSHYTIDELIARWKKEMTTEQAIGQILLALKEMERRMREARHEPGRDAETRGKSGEAA